MRKLPINGQVFNNLVTTGECYEFNGRIMAETTCQLCGSVTYIRFSTLKAGVTKSCGCLKTLTYTKYKQVLGQTLLSFCQENDLAYSTIRAKLYTGQLTIEDLLLIGRA